MLVVARQQSSTAALHLGSAETLAPALRVVIGLCAGVVLLFVALRTYARLVLTRSWGTDDNFCILAAINAAAFYSLTYKLIDNPLGLHMWNVPRSLWTVSIQRVFIATSCLYKASSLFLKLSLFALYVRLFHSTGNRLLRGLIHAGIVGVTLFYSVHLAVYLAVSVPRRGETLQMASLRASQPRNRLAVAQAVGSAITDLYAWMLPLPVVCRLHLPARQKAGVCALFLSGLLACFCSVATIVFRMRLKDNPDTSWILSQMYLLTTAELTLGIICACLPAVSTNFRRIASKLPRPLRQCVSLSWSWSRSHFLRCRWLGQRSSQKRQHEGGVEAGAKGVVSCSDSGIASKDGGRGRWLLLLPLPSIPPAATLTGLRTIMRSYNGATTAAAATAQSTSKADTAITMTTTVAATFSSATAPAVWQHSTTHASVCASGAPLTVSQQSD